jgi:ribosomal protein S18 acetylase RimI-like enzyme
MAADPSCESPSAGTKGIGREAVPPATRGSKTPSCVIRSATACDLPAIRQLLVELMSAMGHAEGMCLDSALRTCADLLNDAGSHILVAEVDGSPVGFITFSARQTILHRSPSGLIDELAVSAAHRGRGVGKQLVLAAIATCKEIGCCEVEVSTEKTNTEARELYRKCGFVERGILAELDL